jgi:rubrerythrin
MDLLEQQETGLSELYFTYSERFPEWKRLWKKLADDETNHAKWFRQVRTGVERGFVTVDPEVLTLEEVQKVALFLKKQRRLADSPTLTALDAARAAVHLEAFILEEPFRRVFLTERPKIQILLERLEEETARHSKLVETTLAELSHGAAPIEVISDSKTSPRR